MKTYKTKVATRTAIYKIVNPLTVGFFRDNSWESVRQIWERLQNEGVVVTINDAKYEGLNCKTWYITLDVNGFTIPGHLVASFCGPTSDPTSVYDLCFII